MNYQELTQHTAFAEFQAGVLRAMIQKYGSQEKLVKAMMADPVGIAKQGVEDYLKTCEKLGKAALQEQEKFAKILYPFI